MRGKRVTVTPGQDQRVVGHRHQRLQVGIDSPEQRPEVVVLPEKRVKTSAHRDLISAVADGPGTHPPAELVVRLDHDHRHSTLGQSDGGCDPGNATARHNHRLVCAP